MPAIIIIFTLEPIRVSTSANADTPDIKDTAKLLTKRFFSFLNTILFRREIITPIIAEEITSLKLPLKNTAKPALTKILAKIFLPRPPEGLLMTFSSST